MQPSRSAPARTAGNARALTQRVTIPTPHSLAATEGYRGQDLEVALDSLDRARDADNVGNVAVCQAELAAAKAILRPQRH
jgi:hypothetical protein